MTPTRDERREVAERLRDDEDSYGYAFHNVQMWKVDE